MNYIEKKRKEEQDRLAKLEKQYNRMILKAKTIRDCEDILRELVKDDIPGDLFRRIYFDIESRGRQIKENQQKILDEAAAAVATTEKMLASARA